MRLLAALGVVLSFATVVIAQQPLTSPYRGQLASEIRGLSAQEIDDLREGRGMGLARAAELNGYPGPKHVLEAFDAGQLHLSAEQLSAVRQLFARMSRDARRLGDLILKEEQALEAAFRAGTVEESALQARAARIAGFHGELRVVHLRTHLETRALLTEHQLQRYNQVRGYTGGEAGHAPHRH